MSEENQVATIKEKQLPIKLGITNAALTKLEKEYKDVPDATTPEGYALHKATKKKLTGLRTGVEAERKLQVAEAVLHQRRVNKVANQITTRIVAIEEPWYKAKKAVDDALAEKKRQESIKEQNRIEDIEDLISDIRALTANLLGADAETIQKRLDEAGEIHITDDVYMEYIEQASQVLAHAKTQLTNAVETAKVQAKQQEQLDAQEKDIANTQRKAKLQESIGRIRMAPVDCIGKSVADIEAAIDKLEVINVVPEYGDLSGDADKAIEETVKKLEAMVFQQKNLDDQQKAIDDREAEATRKEDERVEAERIQMEQEETDKQRIIDEQTLADRMPEDIKVRTWMDNILAVEPPEVEDAHLCAILRDGLLMLSDLNKRVYDGTQSPVDEDGDKVE